MSPGIEDSATRLGERLMSSLPAQFLALVVINAVFICALIWFLAGVDERRVAFEQQEATIRQQTLGPIFTACIEGAQK